MNHYEKAARDAAIITLSAVTAVALAIAATVAAIILGAPNEEAPYEEQAPETSDPHQINGTDQALSYPDR